MGGLQQVGLQWDKLRRWEVNGNGSEQCPVVDFSISGIKPSVSSIRESVSQSHNAEIQHQCNCDVPKETTQNHN